MTGVKQSQLLVLRLSLEFDKKRFCRKKNFGVFRLGVDFVLPLSQEEQEQQEQEQEPPTKIYQKGVY